MKTGKKNLWLIASLCVAFVISMFFGVYSLNGKKAHATVADNTFEMAGAAVRMDGSQGLRFGAIVADNLVENVEANDNLSFGAFIAPLDWMEYLGITTTYSDSYDYYTNFKTAYAEVSSNTVQHNFHITPYKDNEDGSHELCLTLGGVQYNNMSRTFFGLFCIVNNNGTPSDESDDTFTYARFGDNNKRSYSYVASAALTDTTKNYTSAQKTNLYNVLQLAFYSKNGINQATAESNVAAGTYLEYELELNTSAVTLSVGNTYDIKSSLILNEERVSAKDVLLTYSSSNTDVATVSNSGRITAVGNGTATITVTYANSNGGNYSDSETVSVTVEDSVSYVAITGEYHNNFSVDIAQDNYSVSGTTNNNWANQQDNGFVVQLNGGNNQTKVSFTITNNATTDSNNTLNAKVSIAVGASNMYNDEVELSSTTNGTIGAGRNNATNKGAIINSIAKGEHLNVTITLSSAFSGTNICLKVCPQYSNTTYDPNNTVTISNIYFGSGSAAPSGNAVNIDSADNGSVTANVANAATGDKVYLTVTPSTGYQLASLSVIDESENEVTVQSNVFTMPSSDVTVSATFSKVTYSITNKVSDKVTVASSAQYGDEVNISVADSDYYIVSVTYRANRTLTTIYTDSFEMPNSGVIITAAVVSNDYDINLTNAKAYNANEEEITTAKPGEEITIVANTPATGYEFDEWTSDVTLDGETSTTTFTMTASDVTISASYKLATYTITIDNSITDVWAEVGGVEVTEATYGSTVVLNTDRANSSVASYNGNSGNTFTLTGNITITAVTYDISYTITVTGGTASTSLAAAGTKITITAGAAATGKEFSGWTISPSVTYTDDTSASSSTAYFTMPAADVTITANYTDIVYTITVNNGTYSGTATYGQTITITAGEAAQGKEFSGWTISPSVTYTNDTSASSSTACFTMPAADVTITANYTDRIYNVTVTNGTASPTSGAHGTSISITAAEREGYEFAGWEGNVTFTDATSETTTFEIGYEDVEVMATYKDAVVSTTLTVVSAGKINGNMGFVSNTSTEAIYDSKVHYGGQRQHFGYAKVKCTTADVSTITFKIYNQATGNSNNTLTLYAAVRGSISNSNEDFDDNYLNNLKGITSVTGGSVDTDNSRVRAKFNSISMGSNASVSITLANSISKNTEFYITFASMIDSGFVGNFKIEFAEPVYYTVTNNVNTITVDKENAAEGDTVTLTPTDKTKVVTAFNYTPAGGSATDVSGNTLTMPAKAVTINSVTLGDKVSGETITKFQSWEGQLKVGGSSSSDSYSSDTITATSTRNYGGGTGDALAILVNNTSENKTVSFTVRNACTEDSNNTIKLRICSKTSWSNQADHTRSTISSVTGATQSSDNLYVSLTIGKGETKTVTITFKDALSSSNNFQFMAYADGTGFVGDLIISNITFS